MEILHGFILFLAVKYSSSTEGVVGSAAILNCPFTSTSSYQWQKFVNGVWSNTITLNVPNKYDDADTKNLLIKFLGFADGGRYRCTSSGTHDHVYLTVTDCSSGGTCSQWSSWTVCSTCGGGHQLRSRQCSGICSGDNYESRYCFVPCPVVDGNWGQWGTWSICSATCGRGTRSRYRDCYNPSPSNGGAECQGSSHQLLGCSTELCPVNGKWGTWDNWLSCSVTCDGGTTTRQRSCDNPVPAFNGSNCDGNNTETGSCSVIKCTDLAKSSMSVGAIIAGTLSACVVLLIVAVVAVIIIHRRRQKNVEKHNDYDVSDMRQGEEHFYIQTRTNDDYCNTDLRSPVQVKNTDNILAEFNSSELSKMLQDNQLCEKRKQEEFQWLTKSKPREHGTDYEEVNLPVENETMTSYDTYVNMAVVKKYDTDHAALVTETPNQNNKEMFWTLVNNFKVQDIILLVQKKEKITDFFPMTDEPIEMQSMELKMTSSGRQENDIFLYSLELNDQERKTVSEIRLYKTTNWKIGKTFPDISTLCQLITIPNENSTGVLMIGRGNGYRICGVLDVCLEVVNTIKDDKKFSILQIALNMVKIRPDLFQTFEEYELCYNILRHYVENKHC